tara:strand:- start:2244 stop:2705 length:462 start_codon:yes stop_codon:yes gene_type:complete
MPKSTVSRKKKFREFSKIEKKYVQDNPLKNLHYLYTDVKQNYDLGKAELEFILFIYDLEFWTIQHVSNAMNKSPRKMADRIIYPLLKKEYIYKHFDKLTPTNSVQDYFFREETKFNYRVRYALSQKGRLMVARINRKMRGEEPFNYEPYEQHP